MKNFDEMSAQSADQAMPEVTKSENPDFDENGVPKELWPYRDQMQTWLADHQGDLETFLEYRDAKFKVICGTGFFYRTADHIISLSVPMFKEKIEAGQSLDVILFAAFHEFAHLKSITELDPAGRKNHKSQYIYEGAKVIRDQEDPQKWASLQSAYRQYYNILEDAIVNHLVFDTQHFGDATVTGKKHNQSVREWYTTSAFCLYKDQGVGQSDYAPNPDPVAAREEPVIHVGPGLGNLAQLTLEDYQAGFDWNSVFPPMQRSGQFLTWFIKNQMLGLDPKTINDPEKNLQGQNELHPDVAMVFTRPITEVYTKLLEKVLVKYKDNPEQYQRYLDFMSSATVFVEHSVKNGQAVSKNDVIDNVVNQSAVNDQNEVNILLAKLQYLTEVKSYAKQLDLDSVQLTFLDIFNRFKIHTRAQQYSWTLPLKYTAAERFKVNRHILEKIYTLLCILDDSFDVTLPPEQGPGPTGGSGGGPGGDPGPERGEKRHWKIGEKVVRILGQDADGQDIYGDKGVISSITHDATGNISSVEVEYYDSSNEKMADAVAGRSHNFAQRNEVVYDPNKNLAIISGDSGGQGGQSADDDRKRYKDPKKEQEKKDQKKEEKKDKDPKDSDNQDPSKQSGQDQEQNDQEKPVSDMIDPYAKFLDDMIAEDERQKNTKELKEYKESPEYQQKENDEQRAKDLLEAVKNAKKNKLAEHQSSSDINLSDERVVQDFIELEKKLAPYSEAMAQNWLEIVNNIASHVEIIRDRYYRSGRLDVKKVQRHYAEISLGADMEQKLLYEQFIEKITIELQPKMLRLILAIDNSGSMNTKLENMRMVIMLLNNSLRSLRSLFKDKMTQLFGTDMDKRGLDIVCDSELYLYGNNSRLIKPFTVQDLSFVDDETKDRPEVRVDQETLDTILAFQRMTVNEGTYDEELWALLMAEHEDPELGRLIQENKMTEVIFQIGDGDIMDQPSPFISHLRDQKNISIGGFAVGSSPEEARQAADALAKRHGAERVIPASSAEEIVSQFGELLKQIITDKIQKPMIEALDKIE